MEADETRPVTPAVPELVDETTPAKPKRADPIVTALFVTAGLVIVASLAGRILAARRPADAPAALPDDWANQPWEATALHLNDAFTQSWAAASNEIGILREEVRRLNAAIVPQAGLHAVPPPAPAVPQVVPMPPGAGVSMDANPSPPGGAAVSM